MPIFFFSVRYNKKAGKKNGWNRLTSQVPPPSTNNLWVLSLPLSLYYMFSSQKKVWYMKERKIKEWWVEAYEKKQWQSRRAKERWSWGQTDGSRMSNTLLRSWEKKLKIKIWYYFAGTSARMKVWKGDKQIN